MNLKHRRTIIFCGTSSHNIFTRPKTAKPRKNSIKEAWNLHRCERSSLTFPNDYPEEKSGSNFISSELERLQVKAGFE